MCAQTRLSSGSDWEDKVGYSRLVRSGLVVEVSGTVAIDQKGDIQGKGDPYRQTQYILGRIRNTLAEAGIDWTRVIRSRMYVTDIGHWPEIGRAHREAFVDIRPAATMVEVQRLILPDLLVEIEVTAMAGAQYNYQYARPALTTDILLTRTWHGAVQVLLIKRRDAPFKDHWALPGGFVEEDETLEKCAARELQEETGLRGIDLQQFRVYSTPGRDPRGWTISSVFHGEVDEEKLADIEPGDDAADTAWFAVSSLPLLAFDHKEIIGDYLGEVY